MATTWTGAVNNNWGTAGNWDNGLPSSVNDAYIPSSATAITVDVVVAGTTVILSSGTRTLAAGAGSFRNDCTFAPVGGTILTVAAPITTIAGGNTMTVSGGGVVYLTNLGNNVNGILQVTANATLRIASANALGAVTSLQLGAGIFGATFESVAVGALTFTRPVVLTNSVTFANNGGGDFTLANDITGAGQAVLTGLTGNAIALSSATNSFTGGVTVFPGRIFKVSNDGNLGAVPASPTTNLYLSAATLRFTSSFTLAPQRLVSLTGNSTIAADTGITGGIAGVISGAYSIAIGGPGQVVFYATNTFSGGLSIPTGTSLGVAVPEGLGTGTVTLAGGSLLGPLGAATISYFSGAIGSFNSYSGQMTLVGAAAFTLPTVGTSKPTIVVTSGSSLNCANLAAQVIIRYQGGTVTNASFITATYSSGTLVGGYVRIESGTWFRSPAISAAVWVEGGILDLGGGSYALPAGSRMVSGTMQNGMMTNPGGISWEGGNVTAVLATAGPVVKTTSGTLTLAGSNTYTGGTTVSAGILVAGSGAAFGSDAITLSGGTLNLSSFSIANSLTYTGGAILNGGGFTGVVTVNAPSGSFTTTAVPFAPSFVVQAGVLSFGGFALTVPVTLNAGGILDDGSMPAANLTLTGSGNANINVTLTGAGGLTIPLEILLVLNVLPTSTGPVTLNGGLYFSFTINGTWSAPIVNNGVIAVQDTAVLTLSGNMTGNGSIPIGGGSTLTLSGSNSGFSGNITPSESSTLIAGSDTAFGTGLVVNGGAGGSGAFNIIDLDGYAVATGINAQYSIAVGYVKILNGDNYAGTLNMNNGAKVVVPSGNALAGTANVNVSGLGIGELVIEGQHTGGIINSGVVVVDNSTATNPPVNGYIGSCGSTYAVRAA